MNQFLVSISCITYNHSAYITDAMDGFVMQQTKFPFVAVIIDDASTDGEQEVIKAYLEKHFDHSQESGFKEWETEDAFFTFARHKENENCHFVAVCLKRNLFKEPEKKDAVVKEWFKAKYIALCEGDDYWIDPLKLQKQVDYLEKHLDFSMCIHGADVKNESSRCIEAKCESIESREYFSKDVFPDWVVPTASIVYRNSMLSNYHQIKHGEWSAAGDIVIILKGTHTGRVWGMAEHMSVYRMNDGSIMARPVTDESYDRMCNHYNMLLINFPQVDKAYCKKYIASINYTRFRQSYGLQNKIKHLYTAVKYSPKYVWYKLIKII